MLTRRIFFRSKHIHGRVMTNSILEEETILASVLNLFHAPAILFRPGCKSQPNLNIFNLNHKLFPSILNPKTKPKQTINFHFCFRKLLKALKVIVLIYISPNWRCKLFLLNCYCIFRFVWKNRIHILNNRTHNHSVLSDIRITFYLLL